MFYHVYATGDWNALVRDQVTAIPNWSWSHCDLISVPGLYYDPDPDPITTIMTHVMSNSRIPGLRCQRCPEVNKMMWSVTAQLSQIRHVTRHVTRLAVRPCRRRNCCSAGCTMQQKLSTSALAHGNNRRGLRGLDDPLSALNDHEPADHNALQVSNDFVRLRLFITNLCCTSRSQEVDEARELVQKFGTKFNVFATEVNGSSYERLTLHGIRGNTQPGDAVLCALPLTYTLKWTPDTRP